MNKMCNRKIVKMCAILATILCVTSIITLILSGFELICIVMVVMLFLVTTITWLLNVHFTETE